jgi:aromatic ring-cleaving dioxygenase
MAEAAFDPGAITGYHAHLYYDALTRKSAAKLRERIAALFPMARLGNWHDGPVGPHPVGMYQIAFAVADFPRLVPWLMLNRGGHVVLVHPLTGDDYADHAHHALWLGEKLPLDLEILRKVESGSR